MEPSHFGSTTNAGAGGVVTPIRRQQLLAKKAKERA
jgi:hypothetical protein